MANTTSLVSPSAASEGEEVWVDAIVCDLVERQKEERKKRADKDRKQDFHEALKGMPSPVLPPAKEATKYVSSAPIFLQAVLFSCGFGRQSRWCLLAADEVASAG